MTGRKGGLGFVSLLVGALVVSFAHAQTTRPIDYYGRVVGPDGKAISGAAVNLVQYRTEARGYVTVATAKTDADGKFRVSGPDSTNGTAIAVIRAPELGLIGGPMQDSDETSPAEFRFRATSELRLRFVTAEDKPVQALKVWPTYISKNSAPNWYVDISPDMKDLVGQTTDADGVATFKGLPAGGNFEYTYSDPRFATPITEAIAIPATAGADVTTRKVEPAGSVSGKVTFADTGKPVAGLLMYAQGIGQAGDNRQSWQATATTDADGNYGFEGLRSGQYSIHAQLESAMSAKYAPPRVESFNLGSAEKIAGKDMTLAAGGVITGKVTVSGTGAPVAKAQVYATSNSGNPAPSTAPTLQQTLRTVDGDIVILNPVLNTTSPSTATTGDDGTYSMHVLPGQVQVTLGSAPPGFIVPRTTPAARGTPPAPRPAPMQLAENETLTKDLEVDVDPIPLLKGIVVDSTGRPVSGASLYFERTTTTPARGAGGGQPAPPISIRADAEGKFVVRNVPNGMPVRARKGNMGTPSKVIVSDSNRQDLKLTLQKEGMASASVQVTGNDGKPVPDAQVSFVERLGSISMSVSGVSSSDDTTFIAPALFPDTTYYVTGRGKGFGSGSVTLQGLQAGKQLDAKLQLVKADSFVSGMVLDENQLPMTDVEVYVSAPRTGGQTVKTDITGHFRANGIVAGDAVTVYTRVGSARGQAQPERVPAGTSDMILIHDPASVPQPTTRPLPAARL